MFLSHCRFLVRWYYTFVTWFSIHQPHSSCPDHRSFLVIHGWSDLFMYVLGGYNLLAIAEKQVCIVRLCVKNLPEAARREGIKSFRKIFLFQHFKYQHLGWVWPADLCSIISKLCYKNSPLRRLQYPKRFHVDVKSEEKKKKKRYECKHCHHNRCMMLGRQDGIHPKLELEDQACGTTTFLCWGIRTKIFFIGHPLYHMVTWNEENVPSAGFWYAVVIMMVY